MSKYLYFIKDLKLENWIKWWLVRKGSITIDYVLGELMTGTDITINNTVEKKFYKFDIKGNSVQDGTPTLNSPVEILSSGDVINLYNKNDNKEDYYINNEGTEVSNNAWVITDYIEVSDTIIYSGLSSTGTAPYSAWYNENKEYISSFKQQAGTNILTIETGAKYVRFSVRKSEVDNFFVRKEHENISIIITNSDNSQSQNYIIPVQQPMRSIGLVRDEFIKINNVLYKRHNVIRKYFKDFNYTFTSTTSGNLFRIGAVQLSDIRRISQTIKSNIFIGIPSSTGRSDGKIYYNSSNYSVDIICDSYDNATDFKTAVTEKNGYFDILLETPLDLPCTEEQISILENMPKSYNEQTNIYSIDTIPAYLEVQAYVKKEEVIDNEGN